MPVMVIVTVPFPAGVGVGVAVGVDDWLGVGDVGLLAMLPPQAATVTATRSSPPSVSVDLEFMISSRGRSRPGFLVDIQG